MSAIPVHQSHILPQKIDSHEGLVLMQNRDGMCMRHNEYLLGKAAICICF